jgi:hypothetical protein
MIYEPCKNLKKNYLWQVTNEMTAGNDPWTGLSNIANNKCQLQMIKMTYDKRY